MFKINWKNLALSEDDKKFLSGLAERPTHIRETVHMGASRKHSKKSTRVEIHND